MAVPIQSAFDSWSFPTVFTFVLLLTALVYLRGWYHLDQVLPGILSVRKLAAFLSSLAFLWIAIASPLANLDDRLVTIRVLQHILLLAVVPPLLLLGEPAMPFLRGLPRIMISGPLAWGLRRRLAQRFGHFVAHPALCWLAAVVTMAAWHFPVPFQLALHSESWHVVEQGCFLGTAILFWLPVVQPWPSMARWPRWSIPLYLLLGMAGNNVLSAVLAFSDGVLYPAYADSALSLQISPINDQACAGALMWVFGTFVYLVPAVIISVKLLSPAIFEPTQTLPAPTANGETLGPAAM